MTHIKKLVVRGKLNQVWNLAKGARPVLYERKEIAKAMLPESER